MKTLHHAGLFFVAIALFSCGSGKPGPNDFVGSYLSIKNDKIDSSGMIVIEKEGSTFLLSLIQSKNERKFSLDFNEEKNMMVKESEMLSGGMEFYIDENGKVIAISASHKEYPLKKLSEAEKEDILEKWGKD